MDRLLQSVVSFYGTIAQNRTGTSCKDFGSTRYACTMQEIVRLVSRDNVHKRHCVEFH